MSLTIAEMYRELMAFAKAERQSPKQAQDPELEALMKKVDERHAKDALDLTDKQDRELGSTPERAERRMQERQEQNKKFAEERDRYISEYHETRRLQNEIRGREKEEALERGEDLDKGFSR